MAEAFFLHFDPEENPDELLAGGAKKLDIWEWAGTPVIHDGEEIWSEPADIRWNKIRELWERSLIDGIAESTKSIEVTDNEND